MSGAYDGLWDSHTGKHGWWHKATEDEKEWCVGLAALIVEKGREPTWAAVGRQFRERFGYEGSTPQDSTIQAAVRKLVKACG